MRTVIPRCAQYAGGTIREAQLMLAWGGDPLKAGQPDYTDDHQFWDGTRLYHLAHGNVRKRQSRLLQEAEVMAFNLLDCTPNSPVLGSKHLATESQRHQLVAASEVRSPHLR